MARSRVTHKLENKVIALYKEGHSFADISNKLDIGHTTANAILQRRKPNIIRAQNNALPVDERFFHQFSSKMAWCLGWLWTDGCLTKPSSIELSSNDMDVLKKFRKAVKGKQRITWSVDKSRGYRFSRYRVGSKVMAEKLRRMGLTERKSLVVKFPKVPKKYLGHFVRGVFEGDGSVKWRKKEHSISVTICTASKAMFKGLMATLEGLGFQPTHDVQRKAGRKRMKKGRLRKVRENDLWVITMNKIKDIQSFYELIYKGVPSTMRMKRKYDRYRAYLRDYWKFRHWTSPKARPIRF